MVRRVWSVSPVSLSRVFDAAVARALVSAVAAGAGVGCSARSADDSPESVVENVERTPPAPEFSFGRVTAGAPGVPTADSESAAPAAQERSQQACELDERGPLAHMQLAEAYDFVALRVVTDGFTESGRQLATVGQACAGAADASACRDALALAWPDSDQWMECGQTGCQMFGLVTTRGDSVELHDDLPEILAVLGKIDTPEEALLWADANGYEPSCAGMPELGLDGLQLLEFADGYRLRDYESTGSCPLVFHGVVLDIARDGRLNEAERFPPPPSNVSVCVGRRPPGLVAEQSAKQRAELGDFFAGAAALEAAAVTAFHVIEAELADFGAPEELRAAAREAAADEERHFSIMSGLAAEWGASAKRPFVEPRPLRSLFDFALDNLVEGCIREAFGAAVAGYQAAAAAEPRVRALLAAIAGDERRHAELSFRLQAWLVPQLGPGELAHLEAAARAAIAELRDEQRFDPSFGVQRAAGMPSAAAAARLLEALEATLWTPALSAA